ncbi:MAG TPA: PDZ domain-containing protein [Candidatus Atopostipes pullistercoris]|uniref:PDZ domain-containing protein n=1 Tax=Candidatus Atopostipes pullistercoris TaxID=2838467 RepID=A0A9D2G1U8_9LACT|nr:PDZ domain-containing protein [Candidatus Atopostipes pullistercoris]
MKKISTWIKTLLIFAVLYLFFFLPLPLYLEVPGQAFELNDMVEVDHEYFNDSGDFYITTVGIQQATPFTALSSVFPFRDLVTEKELFGDIDNYEEYNVIQNYYMDSSINTAIQVAFEEADKDYELLYNGVYVLQVLDNSSFADELKVGDTVKSVDGLSFDQSHDFIEYVSAKEVGEKVDIEFEREGELLTASGELIPLDTGVAGIGIGLVDNTSLETVPEVSIHSGEIGGPSAGLMFSLQIYSQLMSENIHGSHKIAGTGTISPDGSVGRIGGIAKKVVAADEKGAEYFFAPDDELDEEVLKVYPKLQTNYQEALDAAEAIDTEMEIIPVKTISDALDFLEELNQETTALNIHPLLGTIIDEELLAA